LIILLTPSDSQWVILEVDAVKLHQSCSLFSSSELDKHVAFVPINIGFDYRVSVFDAHFGSLKHVAEKPSYFVVGMVLGDSSNIDLPRGQIIIGGYNRPSSSFRVDINLLLLM